MARTEKKVIQSVVPFYGVAAVWLGYSFLLGLHTTADFIFTAVLSIGAFWLFGKIFPGEEIEVEIPEKKKEPETTGNPELDKMIRDGELAISEMRRLNDNIEDEKISAGIERLEKISRAIFEKVKEKPEKLSQIYQFMDYYLPTTLKLLNAYDRMSTENISGENIDASKQKVESIMDTIIVAFEKQYDALFRADALDISTDISVLETMMAREGLIDESMKKPAGNPADGTDGRTDIKLEL